ncbi:MAG: hypothetical protein DCC67_07070 [Planctomycetota bacterium]|nr:MAG: hypothetical protein DCC67_07070 [Planctomycetota bacterium]
MKFSSAVAFAFVGIVLGALASPYAAAPRAQTLETAPAAEARFQISAYAGPSGEGFGHGCYLVDTTTGELWHARFGGKVEKIADAIQ